MSEKKAMAESIGYTILSCVERLKPMGTVWPTPSIPVEFFLADDEYDVAMRVWLIPKKSQQQLGEEMFNGENK